VQQGAVELPPQYAPGRWGAAGFVIGIALSLLARIALAPALGRATAHDVGLGVMLGAVAGALVYSGDPRRRAAALIALLLAALMVPVGWLIDRVWP
jgi:hypothetical protein